MYPKIIFTYVTLDGREITVAKDIPLCCPNCEIDQIFSSFQDFINVIADTVAEKYEEHEFGEEE